MDQREVFALTFQLDYVVSSLELELIKKKLNPCFSRPLNYVYILLYEIDASEVDGELV